MKIAVLKISGKPIPVIIEKVRTIITKLTGNADFTTPNPTLVDLANAVDKVEISYQDGLKGGTDKKALVRFYLQYLRNLLWMLLGYIQTTSGGDEAKILSTGVDVRSKSASKGLLPAPSGVRSDYGLHAGEILIRFNGVKGRTIYKIQINDTPNDESKWRDLENGLTGKTKFIADGLVTDKMYGFRVATISAEGISEWSDATYHKAL